MLIKHSLMKSLYGLLIVCLLVPFSTVYGNAVQQVKDISGHQAEAEISDWLEQGLIKGFPDNTFRPDKDISRGEFVALVNRAFKFSTKGKPAFKDLKQTDWVYQDVQIAMANGYISGFSDHTFRQAKPITKQETAVIISKLLKWNNVEASNLTLPEDYDSIPSWSKPSIMAMLDKGIMTVDKDGAFQPLRKMTRAETVVALKKAIAATGMVYDKPGQYGGADLTTIEGDVHVKSPGITLINVQIKGNLVISKEVGDGDVNLTRIRVNGVTTVEGGGINSVYFKDSQLQELKVNREGHIVRIVAEGTTTVRDTQISSGAIIEEKNVTGQGFTNLTILPERQLSTSRKITIAGDFQQIRIIADLYEFNVQSGTIDGLYVGERLQVSNIVLNKAVKVQTLDLNSKNKVSGEGIIDKVLVAPDAENSDLPASPPPVIPAPISGVPGGGGGLPGGGNVPGPGGGTTNPGTGGDSGSGSQDATVKGTLKYLAYNSPAALPIVNSPVELKGVNETTTVYRGTSGTRGEFTFNQVKPGTYIINIYAGLTRYYTNEFEVKPGKTLTVPDLIIEEKGPEPSVDSPVYSDIGYLNGRVFYLDEPFSIKVELENGQVLNTMNYNYDQFFSINLLGHNPDLILVDKSKLYVTMYTSSGWTSERFEVSVVERPQTKTPIITDIVYDDSRYVRGTLEDTSNELYATKMDGTIISRTYNNQGKQFSLYLYENVTLEVGERIMVYAQADSKRKSAPAFITVVAPTVITSAPEVDGQILEDDYSMKGKAEPNATIIVKRSDGTVIGTGKAAESYHNGKYEVVFQSKPIAEEALFIHAKGYEKVISEPLEVKVAYRPVTNTPEITGDIFSDMDIVHAINHDPKSYRLYIKEMNGTVLHEAHPFNEKVVFYNVKLKPDTQYQLTAIAPLFKESLPFVFTTIAPTEQTETPVIAGPVFSDNNYMLQGSSESYAVITIDKENGELLAKLHADEAGTFRFAMPSHPPLPAGTKLTVRADVPRKLESQDLLITMILPFEKSAIPQLASSVSSSDSLISGTASKSALIKIYRENGTPLSSGVYADSKTGNWGMTTIYSVLRGGEKLYIISDEPGKLPSEPYYFTVLPAPKSNSPVITSTVDTLSKFIQGTYSGVSQVGNRHTYVSIIDENGLTKEFDLLESDGTFKISLDDMTLTQGLILRIIVKEPDKEARDTLTVVVS